jgi:hypothetical protein
VTSRPPAVVAVIAALALGVVACGDDDEDEGVSIPSISIPTETTAPAPETTTPTTTAPEGGGTGAEGGQPDSAENDVPPPAGSPQERFEQFCEQNPGACGD